MSYLFKLIDNSVSYFHTIAEAKKKLTLSGFKELDESKPFNVKPGGQYFTIREGSALIAFVVPKQTIEKGHFLISHVDSPTFRIKPYGEHQKENMIFWGLETYGGPIFSTWFNRNLGVAGRIHYEQNKKIKSSLVKLDHAPVVISQLPIHIDRKVNSEGLKVNPQDHLNALASLTTKKKSDGQYLEKLLKQKVKYQKLLDHELFLYPLENAMHLGDGKDLFSAPRIDNLASVAASIETLCKKSLHKSSHLNMIYLASHEEVGSRTSTGADSPFFKQVLERIFYNLDVSFEEMQQILAQSVALSLDGSHALDPKSQDRFEPRHTPIMGQGPTLKVDASACYAYSSELVAKVKSIGQKHQIKIQTYVKKGNERQGSTIGPIFSKKLGVKTLDMGLAQLSMHSISEVASCRDYDQFVKLLGLILKS